MTKRSFTYSFVIVAILMAQVVPAQTIHPYGLDQLMAVSEDDMSGTARYVGLAGAMTAVGGDPTAVKINPAGLGIYRHSQFSASGDGTFRKFLQPEGVNENRWYDSWHLSQVSYVFALTRPQRIAGVVSNNIMVSYAKRADSKRIFTLNDASAHTDAKTDWIETKVDEYVNRHDINVHFAQNISNRVYWGVGMSLEWLNTRQTISRWEYMAAGKRDVPEEYDLCETYMGKAVGWGASAGVLVHPVQAVRFGLSVESPIIGQMRQTYYFTEDIIYSGSSSTKVQYGSPDINSRWMLVTPLKASAGLGLQWKNHGLLSLQYDLQYHKLTGVAHTARAGLEVAMTNHWMLDLGYAYSTLYARQRAALGINYMGNWLRIGVAYNFSWSTGQVKDSYYYTSQGVYKMRENKIVVTFQWNS